MKSNSLKNNSINFLFGLLLFLMLVIPTCVMSLKIVLILLIVLLNLIFSSYKFRIDILPVVVVGLIILKGMVGVFVGVLNNHLPNYTDLLPLFPFYLFWPILYLLLMLNLSSKEDLKFLYKVIFISHTFIIFYNLSGILFAFLGYTIPNIYVGSTPPIFAVYSTMTAISSLNIQMLVFTTPFIFISHIMNVSQFKKLYVNIILIFSIVLMILSSRGIMAFVVLTLPLFVFFMKISGEIKLNKKAIRFFILTIIALFCLAIYHFDTLLIYWDIFGDGFSAQSDTIRFSQRNFLYKAWENSPIWGHGYGVMFYEHERGGYSASFESQYHYELAATGLIGITILCIYNMIIFLTLYKLSYKDKFPMAFLVGYLYFVIATATNPFLSTFDRLLPLYLCISVINVYYKELNEERCLNSPIYL